MADVERLALIINMIKDGIDTVAVESYIAGKQLQDTCTGLGSLPGLTYQQLAALCDEANDNDGRDDDGDGSWTARTINRPAGEITPDR